MSKNNIILDLDNTILSCISINDKKSKLIPDLIQKFPTHYKLDEHNITKYYIFPRNNLQLFLDYIFLHFNVIIWTSASRRYCSFIISNILNNRPIKYIFFDYHVDISNKIYHHSKHLDLLTKTFNIPNVTYENTILIDNNNTIANNSLPYKTYCCTSFNIIKYINTFNQDQEFNNIINHLSSTFFTPNINLANNNTQTNFDTKEQIKQADFVKQNLEEIESPPRERSREETPRERSREETPRERSREETPRERSREETPRERSREETPRERSREETPPRKRSREETPRYQILGWKKVESRSRPGEFSYENIHTGERIPEEPKYEASKIPEESKDLEEYD